jgi:OTU domain-containing protein 6
MAAQAEALAALEAKHEEEWREFRERAETQRQGASKKKLKQIEFQLQQEESDLRYRQHEELEDLEGGDDAATVEEPVVVEDAAAKRREEEERIKAKKLAKAARKKSKREAKAKTESAKAQADAIEAKEVRRNSERKKECAAISRKLVEINRRIKDVAADGHCLYRAVADQSGSTYKHVRETCASFMEAHADDFAPFIEDASFGDHCAKVRSSAEWGGQPELLALARALNRPIVVYSRDSAPLRMGESDGEELVVTYHRDYYALGEHYNSTEPLRP